MWVTEVTLDGVRIPLAGIFASAVIRHGRADALDPPSASSAQIVLLDYDGSQFRVGVPLTIEADGEPRFTGTVTDAAIDDNQLTVIAVGTLASLGRYVIGASDWPSESWSDRVERVFAEAGLSAQLELVADAAWNPALIARVADPEETLTLGDYLPELADSVGAAIADLPDGRVLVQELSARARVSGVTWEEVPDEYAWTETDPGCSWEEADSLTALIPGYPDPLAPLEVSPDEVVFVPVWFQALALENELTVSYGADLETAVSNADSVTEYGSYPGSLDTELALLADATLRGEQRVNRRSWPRWSMPSAALLDGRDTHIGQPVDLSGFPAFSPYSSWRGVLEGWVDTIEAGGGDGTWTQELALSDPLYSGLALAWEDALIDWADVDPETNWLEASSMEALEV